MYFVNRVFNENLVIVRGMSFGGRAGGRTAVSFWLPLENLSVLAAIDTKLAVWVAHIKTQLMVTTQISGVKVKVTVIKN